MVRQFRAGGTIRTFHCYQDCPDVAGPDLQKIVNSALNQLNRLLDDTYNEFVKKYPKVTRPKLYVYVCEQQIDEINAFTDGTDIFLSVASMIGMYSYIRERLDTQKPNGDSVISKGLEVSSEVRVYKNILELIVAHELTHIWHGHRPWKNAVLTAAPTYAINYDDIFSENISIDNSSEEWVNQELRTADILSLQVINGKLVLQNRAEQNYVQQILEVDADCGAICFVLLHLQREIERLIQGINKDSTNDKSKEIRILIHYHSYLLGLLVGASGLMCGFFDKRQLGKPFDRLNKLLSSDHPIHAVRFYKMHATLLGLVHESNPEEGLAEILLSQTDPFAIDIFAHDDDGKDLRNCFWAPAQTKEAQEFIVCLERGWNIIRDSLQTFALLPIPNKYAKEDLQLDIHSYWYDRDGNLII